MSKMVACSMPECDGELKETRATRTSFCVNCAASMGMWKRRGIRQILGRRARLKKYDSRMELLVGPKGVPSEIPKVVTKSKAKKS